MADMVDGDGLTGGPLEGKREAIAALCRRFHVRRLDVFGSATTAAFDPARSDVDLLVEFESESYSGFADRYFGLQESLEGLLGRPVDLLTDRMIRNPYVGAAIARQRRRLYEAT